MSQNKKQATVEESAFKEWAILELFGHRRLAGLVTEVQLGGASFLRLDIPGKKNGEWALTQFYSPAAIYAITPTTPDMARAVAAQSEPGPVSRWELPQLQSGSHESEDDL